MISALFLLIITTNSLVPHYFSQILDHFSYSSSQKWPQRYFTDSTYFSSKGPVYLYLCGKQVCSPPPGVINFAKNTNGLIICLEHRYYGQSLPLRSTSFTKQGLKYLNVQQSLRDTALFISQIKKSQLHNISISSKWITIGIGYSGGLAVWMRYKYSFLVSGSIASSPIMIGVQDLNGYDQRIYKILLKSGEQCVIQFKNILNYAQQKSLSDSKTSFQSQFGAEKLTSRQFLYYIADSLSKTIEEGGRSSICDTIKNKNIQQAFISLKATILKMSPIIYGSYYLNFTNINVQGRNWIWQKCTQLGLFQTWSPINTIRSKTLTLTFFRKYCEDIFGNNTYPQPLLLNNEFGAQKIKITNLIIYQGIEDPWLAASLNSSKYLTIKTANCSLCAHGSDMNTVTKTDPKQLTQIRQFQLSQLKLWI